MQRYLPRKLPSCVLELNMGAENLKKNLRNLRIACTKSKKAILAINFVPGSDVKSATPRMRLVSVYVSTDTLGEIWRGGFMVVV